MTDYSWIKTPTDALEQIHAELDTALELEMVTGAAAVLCRGLREKAQRGLYDESDPMHPDHPRNRRDTLRDANG
jgi:antitoxin component of MazEF toxin-antitoxin module